MDCNICGSNIPDDSLTCPFCGADFPAPKIKRKLPILWIAISLALVIAILVGALTNWYGFYGPTAKIISGTTRTLKSGSFTIEMNTSVTSKSGASIYSDCSTIAVNIDYDREDLTVVILNDEDTVISAIYNGYRLRYRASSKSYTATDIHEDIEQLFDCLESTGDLDLEEFLEELLGEEDYRALEDQVYIHKLKWSALALYRRSNSDSWLKECAGYSKEKSGSTTTYRFTPDLYDLGQAVLVEFQPAFRSDEDYKTFEDELQDLKKTLDKCDLDCSLQIRRGKLTAGSVALNTALLDISIEAEIQKIGSTTMDTEMLNALLAKADCEE